MPACPLWIERGLLLLAGLWFVNLVNFMDGLDWMTVAEAVPITAAWLMLGWLGELPASATIIAAALCGAMLGFAPFNRPVAKIFSATSAACRSACCSAGACCTSLWHQQFAAALLLPLYYLADATVDAAAPDGEGRAVLGGASFAFLPARHRQRLHGVARGRRSIRAQCWSCDAGDRIGHGAFGRGRYGVLLDRRASAWRLLPDVPVFATDVASVTVAFAPDHLGIFRNSSRISAA